MSRGVMVIDVVDDADAALGFVPATVGVNATAECASGGDDGGGSGVDVGGLFDDEFEGEAKIASADFIEAESVGVAIDGDPIDAAAVVFVILGDGSGAVPVDEEVFDDFAFGMVADGAFAAMAGDIGRAMDEFGSAAFAKATARRGRREGFGSDSGGGAEDFLGVGERGGAASAEATACRGGCFLFVWSGSGGGFLGWLVGSGDRIDVRGRTGEAGCHV